MPAILTAFSTDECAWGDVYATSRPSQPASFVWNWVARSRAANIAHNTALDALSWITPPPVPPDLNAAGRDSISATQSSTWVSSSVHAGLVAQSIPWTPN